MVLFTYLIYRIKNVSLLTNFYTVTTLCLFYVLLVLRKCEMSYLLIIIIQHFLAKLENVGYAEKYIVLNKRYYKLTCFD